MEYDKTKQVAEARNKDQANDYLAAGWTLLSVATMTTRSEEYSEPVVRYVVGWLGDLPVVQPSKNGRGW